MLVIWYSASSVGRVVYKLYIGPGIVMILDDAQAGVVCACLIDIQGWLSLSSVDIIIADSRLCIDQRY